MGASLRHLAALTQATGWGGSARVSLTYADTAVVLVVSVIAPDNLGLYRPITCQLSEVEMAMDKLKSVVREYLEYRMLMGTPTWGADVRARIAAADAAYAEAS